MTMIKCRPNPTCSIFNESELKEMIIVNLNIKFEIIMAGFLSFLNKDIAV